LTLTGRDGKTESRDYNNLYTLIPTQPHPWLVEAGLSSSNGLLNVDHQTLQHPKYKNIFGLGDVVDVPTTKTFFGGWQQIHVVRNNVIRNLQGQKLNAHYDGYTQVPLYLSQGSVAMVEHTYTGATWQHLNTTPVLGSVQEKLWARKKKKFLDYYLHKTWGAPYYKFKKTFKELPGDTKPATPAKATAAH
jgi:NADH dehydrogenase FAD-containing subunit